MLDINKEYYVVDCNNFVYFPRIVHIIGIGGSSIGEEIQYYINMSTLGRDETMIYKNDLTRFKTFKECEEYAKKLNEIPENKKRAEKWNSIENQYQLNVLRNLKEV